MLSPAEGEAFGSLSILQPVYGTGHDCRVMWWSNRNTELALPILPWHALIYKRCGYLVEPFFYCSEPDLPSPE